MSLTQKTARGILWNGSSMFLMTMVNFVITAVLAHILFPAAFGLMGMVMIVINFALIWTDLGVADAVIQKQDLSSEQLSTFFYLNVGMGFCLSAICYFSSGFIASFFSRDELVSLLKVASLSFVITSFGQLFRTMLQKQLEFRKLFKIDLLSTVVYGVSSLLFAWKGFGVWSMVYGLLLKQLIVSVFSWLGAHQSVPVKFYFQFESIKGMFAFGMFVFGERIINYFNRNLDYIIIGRFLGADALGFYSLAYNLMFLPVSRISHAITTVTFPAFSKRQSDNVKLRENYLKVIRYIAFVTFPVMAGLLAVAPTFMLVVYGPKWGPSVLVLQILCFTGAIQSIVTTVGSLQYAKGRSDIGFKWSCFSVCVNAIAFTVGVRWGIAGVATLYAIASIILEPLIQGITNRLIDLKWKPFLAELRKPFIGSLLMVAGMFTLEAFFFTGHEMTATIRLISSVMIGVILYGACTLLSSKKMITDLFESLGIPFQAPRITASIER